MHDSQIPIAAAWSPQPRAQYPVRPQQSLAGLCTHIRLYTQLGALISCVSSSSCCSCCCCCYSYGISATPERFSLTKGCSWGPLTPIPGLLLTGQDVVGDGVMSAFLSGTMVARVAGGLSVGLGMLKEIKKWSKG